MFWTLGICSEAAMYKVYELFFMGSNEDTHMHSNDQVHPNKPI